VSYLSSDVCKLTGATYRQLDHWTTHKWITPTIGPTKGSGNFRRWSDDDLVHVAVMVRLVSTGIPPALAAVVTNDGHLTNGAVTITVDRWAIREALVQRIASHVSTVDPQEAAA
jgi:hypothetical protein